MRVAKLAAGRFSPARIARRARVGRRMTSMATLRAL
jgi:hypothetical protein